MSRGSRLRLGPPDEAVEADEADEVGREEVVDGGAHCWFAKEAERGGDGTGEFACANPGTNLSLRLAGGVGGAERGGEGGRPDGGGGVGGRKRFPCSGAD